MTTHFDTETVPVVINCRDRVRDLRRLVAWLENAGHENICLLDNASTHEPLLEYLRDTPHDVYQMDDNLGPYALFVRFGWDLERMGRFIYTDPDVVPIAACPKDLVQRMGELMDKYKYPKVGPGIDLTGLSQADVGGPRIWNHERQLVAPFRALEPGVYDSAIDTTFALHEAGTVVPTLAAIRTGWPYQINHMPWHGQLDAEDVYYREHCKRGDGWSTWTGAEP